MCFHIHECSLDAVMEGAWDLLTIRHTTIIIKSSTGDSFVIYSSIHHLWVYDFSSFVNVLRSAHTQENKPHVSELWTVACSSRNTSTSGPSGFGAISIPTQFCITSYKNQKVRIESDQHINVFDIIACTNRLTIVLPRK